jgi:hypothetical protein
MSGPPVFSGWCEERARAERALVADEAWPGLVEEFDAEMFCDAMLATIRSAGMHSLFVRERAGLRAAIEARLRAASRRAWTHQSRSGREVFFFEYGGRVWEMISTRGEIWVKHARRRTRRAPLPRQ